MKGKEGYEHVMIKDEQDGEERGGKDEQYRTVQGEQENGEIEETGGEDEKIIGIGMMDGRVKIMKTLDMETLFRAILEMKEENAQLKDDIKEMKEEHRQNLKQLEENKQNIERLEEKFE